MPNLGEDEELVVDAPLSGRPPAFPGIARAEHLVHEGRDCFGILGLGIDPAFQALADLYP